MKVIIKTIDDKLTIRVNSDTKVEHLKSTIKKVMGYHINEQILIFSKKILNSNNTISESGIVNLSTINLHINPLSNLNKPEVIKIFIQSNKGTQIELKVFSNIITEDLMSIAWDEFGRTVNDQILVFESKKMKPGLSLKDMGVRNRSIVYLKSNYTK
ncbi:hypothetical protein CONCODRAFT_2846 [Conidiobolus coronatus NRRL 28638]|uniref:Ubiquitin-like domain-containing protein n=1 Tax=Conidiobolus coronatus (strain ATCC 28846 / CBS 209.66 / NRRL 28638) TaxID=796925 RepID=A0A137PGL0_CONC2|nr:hypothetical protein CONCODRAFT_2846 [Conidiobolus coronatus NRRL 28638]|eukprot:KXN74134.1 hypothetical protein CONCODRAFT_2846 [Conidiobolus coronatus NRRL 28638]